MTWAAWSLIGWQGYSKLKHGIRSTGAAMPRTREGWAGLGGHTGGQTGFCSALGEDCCTCADPSRLPAPTRPPAVSRTLLPSPYKKNAAAASAAQKALKAKASAGRKVASKASA